MRRYSQLYIERGRPQDDSQRARVRLAAVCASLVDREYRGELADLIRKEVGVNFGPPYFGKLFSECEVRDLLDAITVIYDYLRLGFSVEAAENWHIEVNRIFLEENLSYQLDNAGVAHPYIDPEFAANRISALEALCAPKFGEARTDLEAAYRHLRGREYKQAMRMMFPAVEVAAKVLFPGKFPNFGPGEVERHIAPKMRARYAGNQPAIDGGNQLLTGMKNWINAAQPYRHGQPQQEPAEPPEDFVISHLSIGASYLRWMIELCSDQETGPA